MIRLGFGTRLFVIFLGSLLALQLLAVVAFLMQRSRDTSTEMRLPLPDQAAALVELLEAAPKAKWPTVLRAASSTELRAQIAEGKPQSREPDWFEAPVVDLILRRYLAALGNREVRVRVEAASKFFSGPLRVLSWISPGEIEIEIGLKSGETLIVTAGGVHSLSIFGLPPGLIAGVLGIAVALITVWLVRREARPLRDLAEAVDRISLPQKAEAIADVPGSAPEIRGLIAAFNRLSGRIANLLQARMALVGGISHDLRTYATRLRLRAEMIGSDTERARAIHDIDDMQRLLDDSLLAIQDGAAKHAEELIDVAPLLEREVDDRRLAGAAVMLQMSPAARSARLIGDPIVLRRLIANLTDNAIAYGQTASISADCNGGRLALTIDDKGPGISAEQRQMVLEPFVRLEGSRNRRTGGAGLGLAIARNAAEAHGGSLTLTDAPGGGTRAIVDLPLFEDAAADEQVAELHPLPSGAA